MRELVVYVKNIFFYVARERIFQRVAAAFSLQATKNDILRAEQFTYDFFSERSITRGASDPRTLVARIDGAGGAAGRKSISNEFDVQQRPASHPPRAITAPHLYPRSRLDRSRDGYHYDYRRLVPSKR